MKIYTKMGDEGKTALYGGELVDKTDNRVEAYGTVDELNALIGVAISADDDGSLTDLLSLIQADLFIVGAELATPAGVKTGTETTSEAMVTALERKIDEMEEVLPPLTSFILPGGVLVAAYLHQTRTVCRRAERVVVGLGGDVDPVVKKYLNRLSDFLFVAARWANFSSGHTETPWKPRE